MCFTLTAASPLSVNLNSCKKLNFYKKSAFLFIKSVSLLHIWSYYLHAMPVRELHFLATTVSVVDLYFVGVLFIWFW